MAQTIRLNGKNYSLHSDNELWIPSDGLFGGSGRFVFRLGEDGESYYNQQGNEINHLRGKNLEEAVKSV